MREKADSSREPAARSGGRLLVRPDGHLALALSGVDESQLRAAARTVCGA
ncbi:hypothetical protein ABZ711_26870, partial [Streptomyces albidoflavus]